MQQQLVMEEMQSADHPARVFVRRLFKATGYRIEDDTITLFVFGEGDFVYTWRSDNQLEINGQINTYFGWFDFDVAKGMVKDFDKRVHVKVALPFGKFVDPIAQRFVKDMVKAEDLFVGVYKVKFKIKGRWIEWSWHKTNVIHVVRDEEPLGTTVYFSFHVVRFLLDEWQKQGGVV